ncbi:hypothetical protein [Actinophytocola glycyrrhizae]|uniref:Uncharacterized protein n=1 Tax=Actinophytocola glycyrrhizae TaxID=2044873 RepID=A0ABV9RX97_9PSEU
MSASRVRWRRVLIVLEAVTGVAAVIGGLLLVIAPDGALLRADPAVLAASPFRDWRLPGVLLAVLVGFGFLVTAVWQSRRGRWARELSMFAGAGLVAFESVELVWLGFQPLEAVFAAVGLTIIALATTLEA